MPPDPEKIKFLSSSCRVMFFSLYRQNDTDKVIERNYQNYVIDKLTCEIMENKPLGFRVKFQISDEHPRLFHMGVHPGPFAPCDKTLGRF